MNHVEIFKRFQRLQGGEKDIGSIEVHRASELSPDDPRWEILAKALGKSADELKSKNLVSDYQRGLNQQMDEFGERLLKRRSVIRQLGDEYWHDADPKVVPIQTPYGRQRYFDPSSLGVDPIMAQGGTGEVRDKVPPFFVNGKWWWEKAAEDDEQGHVGLRPMAEMPDDEEDLSPEELRREQEDYKRRVRESQYIQAQRGTGNVQHLAEGTSNLNYDPSYPGPTNPHESGSGYWTSRLVGTGVGTASNFFVPGLGLLTGPIASWAMRMYQNGASQSQVQNAVRAYQTGSGQSSDTTTAPATDDASSNVTAPVNNAPPSAGIGIDPFGNPADPGEFWSNDFGRWGEGDQYGTTPGNYNPPGPGGVAGTRGVWGGQTTIPIASDPNFTPSLGWAMPAASGGGAYGGNTMAKIAMHGTFKDIATPEQWAFMQNYLSGGGGGGGGGQGVGGAGRPMTQSQQMGTSSVNPGLKLFHAIQKRKK